MFGAAGKAPPNSLLRDFFWVKFYKISCQSSDNAAVGFEGLTKFVLFWAMEPNHTLRGRYSAFGDPAGYAGSPPSVPFLKALFTDYMSAYRIYIERDIGTLPGTVLKQDHTFDFLKFICGLKGEKIFTAEWFEGGEKCLCAKCEVRIPIPEPQIRTVDDEDDEVAEQRPIAKKRRQTEYKKKQRARSKQQRAENPGRS
ncbi:hypothetical protein B0H14DRAFT_3692282 [Mycena olivaceomarginata]|nr:hypothetical protein B0H14DRAFT_3692282 [Mycena olivaceomarginata]